MKPPKALSRFSEIKSYIREEFVAHLPFTLIGVAAGVAFVLLSLRWNSDKMFGEEEFHWAHVCHIFFSAAAGAAIFKSYHDSLFKAVPVSVISAIVLCTLSDILIPFLGLNIFGYGPHLHLCLLEHPARVILSAFVGAGIGLLGTRFFGHCNRGFHLLHILISTAASALYLLAFVDAVDARALMIIAVTLFIALVVPCLAGDVVVPLFFVRIREEYLHEKVHHSCREDHPKDPKR